MSRERALAAARSVRLAVFDFDGVFTDNRVLVDETGREAVFCNRSDGLGLEMLRAAGIAAMVLSKERNPVVGARCRKLRLDYLQGIDHKGAALQDEVRRRGLELSQVAFMGNDVNDLECLQLVGLPACVADAYEPVKAASLFVAEKNGGYGAVREFCDFLLSAAARP